MGKFFDALSKTRAAKEQTPSQPVSERVVENRIKDFDSMGISMEVQPTPKFTWQHSFGTVDPRLVSIHEANSLASECFKILRAKLLCNDLMCQGRTIMITSAQPRDGKSFVAANLAVSIALGINEFVLLADCDIRMPSQHLLFGLSATPGLREYLEDGTSIGTYLTKTQVEKLTLLPAGMPPTNPSELLNSLKMQTLIEELRSRYQDRYVILDATPAEITPETTSLTAHVDGVLLVVRAGKTSVEAVKRVVENIGREKILGIILNGSNEMKKGYNYTYALLQSKKSNTSGNVQSQLIT